MDVQIHKQTSALSFMPVLKVLLFLLIALSSQAQLQPFFAPVQPAGTMSLKLHPMENVTAGSPALVTFGVPFTRGSMSAAGLATLRVLHNGVEVPAFRKQEFVAG